MEELQTEAVLTTPDTVTLSLFKTDKINEAPATCLLPEAKTVTV
ncbi:MAG: hypothetical protein NWE96_04385 [Candidatus Bathyarchaeota archaeon]|nr:hypothetical protein [Candidatus Bathyarchaeota archaeon]